MRPLSLELSGFGPFRERTTIDFRDHDLISFTGPTGAGKSTIIDGIVFALYGSVARYDNTKLVAPVINAVSSEARVRLDYAVGSSQYTAVRVVRRSTSGASTKEARLEHDGDVLASTAQEVSATVEQIVGLNFAQFTKTVVLPQGEFAQFLKEKPSARQRLLRHLLGLEVFADVGKAARTRARDVKAQADGLANSLTDATLVSVAELDELAGRVVALETDLEALEAAAVFQKQANASLAEAKDALAKVDSALERVVALSVPAGAKSFSSKFAKAEAAVAAAEKILAAATEKKDAAIEARSALPSDSELRSSFDMHTNRATAFDRMASLTTAHEKAEAALAKATTAAERAGEALQHAEVELEHARLMSGAQGIAASLHVGDDCPVCTQLIERMPKHPTKTAGAKALAAAERARTKARTQAESAVTALKDATAAKADAAARVESLAQTIEELDDALASEPTHKQLLAMDKKVNSADAKVAAALEKLEEATVSYDKANADREEVVATEATLRRAFTEARDQVAGLAPPSPSEESLLDDWTALVSWGSAQAKELKAAKKRDAKVLAVAEKQVGEADRALTKIESPHVPNLSMDPDQATAILRDAHADARVLHASARDRVARQESTHARIDELNATRLRVEELGKHLLSGAFEQWILADVMADLAERATIRLLQLSEGAYSLTTDGRDFQIRDHRNADELRNARTLSGGETFLTSLSLALALSESIADLASTATPPLESMFLDEGFGTLDAETLDTVAAAVEELGSTGKLVGVVTHIGDLAERIPARFEVKPSPTGSTVIAPGTETAVR